MKKEPKGKNTKSIKTFRQKNYCRTELWKDLYKNRAQLKANLLYNLPCFYIIISFLFNFSQLYLHSG